MKRIILLIVFLVMFLSVPVSAAPDDAGITVPPSYQTSPDGIGNGIPDTGDPNKDRNDKNDNADILTGFGNLVKSITELPVAIVENLFVRFFDLVSKGMSVTIITNIQFYLGMFTNFLRSGDSHLFSDTTVLSINGVMCPVAYSIMTILFLIGMSKATINLEIVSTEVVIKYGLMLVITKLFVDKSPLVLSQICNANNYLTTKILDLTSTNIDSLYNMSAGWDSGMAPMTTIDNKLGLSAVFLIFALIALLSALAIFVVLILRQIHLAVLICAAPLFFATMVTDIGNHVFRNYLMNFIAVAFQTTFMSVAVAIFCGSIRSYLSGTSLGISGGFIGMCIGLIGLSFYMVKIPNTINSILGAHGSGGGINIASIASLFARV